MGHGAGQGRNYLQRVVIPASVTYIDGENVYDCGDAAMVTPRGSYAWNWATGWGIPCAGAGRGGRLIGDTAE